MLLDVRLYAGALLGGWMWFAGGTGALAQAPWGAEMVEKENVVEARAGRARWSPAEIGLRLAVRDQLRTGEFSRAAVRFTDRSVLRVDELTTIEVTAPRTPADSHTLKQDRGGSYFFSREPPAKIEIRTPLANGALRGTEFELRVEEDGTTRLSLFDGEVELGNAQGRIVLRSGEQGWVERGKPPRKTAMLDAVNIIQWCLYYPAVLDPQDLGLSAAEERGLAGPIEAYRAGDLLGVLQAFSAGRRAASAGERLFAAAAMLSVGQVEKAERMLTPVPQNHPGRRALGQLIAAVKFQEWSDAAPPGTASEWLAGSYYLQSRHDLEGARAAARRAAELSPRSGFAWARVGELEFSFGRTMQATQALERSLELSPRHAQAYALQGFVLSAQNRIGAARRSFDRAIELDGALGNAWLGRGLTLIRQNRADEGRRDLQVAAVLEPTRAVFRSYLGKAFSDIGDGAKANLELERAIDLDPQDPTPWLYSAIQRKQENRYNEAIADLERSVELNGNRRLYRSRFLLDQDQAVRGANLAAIYRNNGMIEQSVREAVRAVEADYASAPAHLFLANSYDALRDPTRVLLRYETAWFNELLLAHLLSPVGGGPLSQYVSEQEYSKMFARDGLGISSLTEYRSDGILSQIASQYGTFGNVSYAFDADYYYSDGLRPNSKLSRFDAYATFKLQMSPRDTVFLQAAYQNLRTGDVFQRYDPRDVGRETSVEVETEDGGLRKVVTKNVPALTYDFEEKQEPGLLLAGWRHEWNPGQQTIVLASRLANAQRLTVDDVRLRLVNRELGLLVKPGLDLAIEDPGFQRDREFYNYLGNFFGRGIVESVETARFDLDYRAKFEIHGIELQQILTLGPHSLVAGARVQRGEFETRVELSDYQNGEDPAGTALFQRQPLTQTAVVDFERINLYLYDTWRATRWLSLTAGLAVDSLKYPDNFRNPPINDDRASLDEISPKVGLSLHPWTGATLRGAYLESVSGSSFDESVRLEPTQVAGIVQAYRTVASESLVASVAGAKYRIFGASFEQRLPSRTYLGAEYGFIRQDLDRTIGVVDSFLVAGSPLGNLAASLAEKLDYRESSFALTLNQLIGDRWSFGLRYRYTHSELKTQLSGLEDALAMQLKDESVALRNGPQLDTLARSRKQVADADFHEVSISAIYNHPSGFFARAEANWYRQENDRYVASLELPAADDADGALPRPRTQNLGLPGEDFWHFNLMGGIRFHRNQCELSLGVLNLTGADYRLDPLSPYVELPRDRTLAVRFRLNF